MDTPAQPSRGTGPPDEPTSVLLARVRSGDGAAREQLFARILPALQRWAHQRLPAGVRDLQDTDDLVQVSLTRAFHRLESFESRGQGAFLAYVRQILLNAIRDEIRRSKRQPGRAELVEQIEAPGPTALENAVGRDTLEGYERALASLHPDQQEAVIMRIELHWSYQEIADHLAMPSAGAARKMICRSLVKLAENMREHG